MKEHRHISNVYDSMYDMYKIGKSKQTELDLWLPKLAGGCGGEKGTRGQQGITADGCGASFGGDKKCSY